MLMTAKGYKIYTSIPGFMADGGKSPKPLLLSVLRYTKLGVGVGIGIGIDCGTVHIQHAKLKA